MQSRNPFRIVHSSTVVRRRDSGYILLTLLFFVAVLAITVAAVLPSVTQEVKRDRELELVHRGVQYSRAIRKFYKKFGRYPTRIEELETTNNIRFLRKRYKDPITGEDFKVLHLGEVKLAMGAGIGVPAAALGAAARGLAQGGSPGLPAQPQVGGQPAGTAAINPAAAGMAATGGITGALGQGSTTGVGGAPASAGNSLTGKTFGGGAIAGVVSTSDSSSIREFGGKSKYSDWQFIYDPNVDRGGLLTTPAQPPLKGAQTTPAIPTPVAPVQMPGPGAPPATNNPPDQ